MARTAETAAIENGFYSLRNKTTGEVEKLRIKTIEKDPNHPGNKFKAEHEGKRIVRILRGPDERKDYVMIAWLHDRFVGDMSFHMAGKKKRDADLIRKTQILLSLIAERDNSSYSSEYELL